MASVTNTKPRAKTMVPIRMILSRYFAITFLLPYVGNLEAFVLKSCLLVQSIRENPKKVIGRNP